MKNFFIFVLACFFNVAAMADLPDFKPLQTPIVSALTGNSEIYPGVVLKDRSTAANRNHVRKYLIEKFSEFGYQAKLHEYSQKGANVHALLPATIQTAKHVLIGAHFDSVSGSPGANDNATGTAMILALADYLQKLTVRNFNVILVLFDEEELGLIGSEAYAAMVKKENVDIHSVHTIDQMGWDQNGNRAIELELPTQELLNLYRAAHTAGGFQFPLWVTSEWATDHSSFRELGYAALGLTEEYRNGDTTPYYHSSKDKFSTVNFDYLNSSTQFFAYVMSYLLTTQSLAGQSFKDHRPILTPEKFRKFGNQVL